MPSLINNAQKLKVEQPLFILNVLVTFEPISYERNQVKFKGKIFVIHCLINLFRYSFSLLSSKDFVLSNAKVSKDKQLHISSNMESILVVGVFALKPYLLVGHLFIKLILIVLFMQVLEGKHPN